MLVTVSKCCNDADDDDDDDDDEHPESNQTVADKCIFNAKMHFSLKFAKKNRLNARSARVIERVGGSVKHTATVIERVGGSVKHTATAPRPGGRCKAHKSIKHAIL